jgi:hypothetical protein
MTATSLDDISAALGTALRSIDDLEVHDTIGAPYNLPAVIVDLPEIPEYMESMGRGGATMAPFHITVLVARQVDDIACSELLAYVDAAGDRSIRQALMDDASLAAIANGLRPVLSPFHHRHRRDPGVRRRVPDRSPLQPGELMAKHNYRVLSDNFVEGNKGTQVSLDDEELNIPALVEGGHIEPVGKTAKAAVADAKEAAE